MQEFYGLTPHEVEQARADYGSNTLTPPKKRSFWQIFIGNLGDPIMKILMIVTGINLACLFYTHNFLETFGIVMSIVIAVTVSTLSELGSESAFQKLEKMSAQIQSRVKRAGKTLLVPATEIVVGEIVLLSSGDKIPADGVMLAGEISVDQSVLNGESLECHKRVSATPAQTADFMAPNQLFAGTVVTGGTGVMQVTAVGGQTVYGKIAAGLTENPPTSPLKVKLSKLANLVSIIGYVGAAIAAVTYLISVGGGGITFHEVLTAVTLVVSVVVMAVPDGLPMMITVVLSSNMRAMMRDQLLVRKLSAVETAGSLNILFTDKTGTITQGKLSVCGVLLPNGQYVTSDFRSTLGGFGKILGTALVVNNEAEPTAQGFIGGNITDRVLAQFGSELLGGVMPKVTKQQTQPFSSATKYMATTTSEGDTYYKGATEVLLPHCHLDVLERARLMQKVTQLNQQAMRVICVTQGEVLLGFIVIRDTVRPEACASIQTLHDAKIQVVLVTGDARDTAVTIAREVGILEHDGLVLTSDELNRLDDQALAHLLPKLRVVARAYPQDKSRLVRVAQSLNLVVGMTGDGVNDAPALKRAELGFAMGSGTEVAKAAGDIVIMDDNIHSITKAVSFGRTLFESIRKFLVFKLTINFIAMAICILAPLFGMIAPITVIQMLWINLVMDTLAGLAFGGEKPSPVYMRQPPKRRDESLITPAMWGKIIWGSVFGSLICMWFLLSPRVQNIVGNQQVFVTVFFTFFMFLNVCNAFNARANGINLLRGLFKNKAFVIIMSAIIVSQFFIVFYGGGIFRTVPVDWGYIIFAGVLALSMLPAEMFRRALFNC
ncbi:MAG: calcium-translocating P-type ATPase, PMCA-type [Eubacteriales bacterium]|nr:calcium-translocating P-type ATPase, PMCA-type [Eubacteriales bacterium]